MNRPRVSIARMLALIAIIGLDCALIRLYLSSDQGLQGLLAYGLAVSLTLIGLLLGSGRFRRFCAGFTISAVLVAVAFVIACALSDAVSEAYVRYYENPALQVLPQWLSDERTMPPDPLTGGVYVEPGPRFFLAVEAIMALPLLAPALVGGLLTLAIRRRANPNLADPCVT